MSFRHLMAFVLSVVALKTYADTSTANTTPDRPALSIEDIRTFTTVFNMVKQAYVEPVDDKTLIQAAIHGLLAGLDPHSEYLDRKQMDDLSEDTDGAYEGLGLEVLAVEGVLRVIAPIDDTPAERGGIKPGDIITRIDDKPITGENANDAVDMLRGKAGSEVVLTVLHEKSTAPIEVKLKRETIRISSVHVRTLEPGYAYIRIAQFQSETGAELKRKFQSLTTKASPIRGAVLDLRSNPGGLLTSAVEVSDHFLDSGVIVTTKGRLKETVLSFSATSGDLLNGVPMVVLMDNGTASAAEIVAGALKDHQRALLMGRRSFGKGSVQTVLPVGENHAVKLTTARYYTPSGISIQAEGILPDIELADLKLSARDASPVLITAERDLPRHLKSEDEKEKTGQKSEIKQDTVDDYALSEALNVLKGMALQHKPLTQKFATSVEENKNK